MDSDLKRLLNIADPARLDRAFSRDVISYTVEGDRALARVESADDPETYQTMIVVGRFRSYNCQCPDRHYRGRSVGPCKHVLSLAMRLLKDE